MKSWLFLSALALSTWANAEEDKVFDIKTEDKAMNAAIQKARDTLDVFLAKHANPPAGASEFKLKVQFPADDGVHNAEHLWFLPFEQTEKGFRGALANEPYFVSNMQNGEVYEFTRQQISDWGYEQGGKQIGNYTVCVLIGQMDAESAASYRQMGFDCID